MVDLSVSSVVWPEEVEDSCDEGEETEGYYNANFGFCRCGEW